MINVDFSAHAGVIDGLHVVTIKQVTDPRGTVRELFRRSAFSEAGIDIGSFNQINLTNSHRGAVRGMHAEQMTKLVSVVTGEAFAAFVDLRDESGTRGKAETHWLRPGVQILVPRGVANGFQAQSDDTEYVYCFDEEWRLGMPGRACNPLDPQLGFAWPLAVSQISDKDRDAPLLAEVLA